MKNEQNEVEIGEHILKSCKNVQFILLFIAVVMGWGIQIGLFYAKQNAIENRMDVTELRLTKLETIVQEGRDLRIVLQSDVRYIKDTVAEIRFRVQEHIERDDIK